MSKGLCVLLACAVVGCATVPKGYFKTGASRQDFYQAYAVCENGVKDTTPLAMGPPAAVLIGMAVGAMATSGRVHRCMEAFGWQYGQTYEGYQP